MSYFKRRHILILVLCSVLLASCSQPPKPSGPRYSGRVLLLNGDTSKGAGVAELTVYGDGYNLATITTGVTEAAVSPDQKRLLYATKDNQISVRDLSISEVKVLIKGEGVCLAWAPDGNHFSYQQRAGRSTKFYVADLDGNAKLILEDPNGATDCAHWIAKDRLVIDRFVGATTTKGTEPLKPNTSTVVTIGGAVKLKDTPRKWSIESVCAKSNVAFVRSADQGRMLVAKNVDHFETLDPSPVSCSECRFIGYAAQSCVPFFIEQPSSTTTELFSLNPTNWQKQRPTPITWIFSPSARFVIRSSARLMVAGDTPDKLLLIDTESGDVTPFSRNAEANRMTLISPAPIVWIEN